MHRFVKRSYLFDEKLGVDNVINEKQKLLMKLRLENEDLTLFELSQKMSDQLGEEISKSNVNHLFRAIHNQADKLRK